MGFITSTDTWDPVYGRSHTWGLVLCCHVLKSLISLSMNLYFAVEVQWDCRMYVCVPVCSDKSDHLWPHRLSPTGSIHRSGEYWSRLPFSTPGDLPDLWIESVSLESPELAGRFFTTMPSGKVKIIEYAPHFISKLPVPIGSLGACPAFPVLAYLSSDGVGKRPTCSDPPSSVGAWVHASVRMQKRLEYLPCRFWGRANQSSPLSWAGSKWHMS